MPTKNVLWNKHEFLAYLLLYAAHVDARYSESERNYILSKIEYPVYKKVLKEFERDNDYQHLQKILTFHRINQAFTTDTILVELYELFLADNHFHRMEKYVLSTIRQLLINE